MSTPDRPDRPATTAAAGDERPLDPDQSHEQPSAAEGVRTTRRGGHLYYLGVVDDTELLAGDVLGLPGEDERTAAVNDLVIKGASRGWSSTSPLHPWGSSIKTALDAADARSVADTGTGPARERAGGFSVPLRTKEQVARRDALRARVQADLARRKATRAS